MPLANPSRNLLPNPPPLIVFDSDRLAIPGQAPRWPEPIESKVLRGLALESAAAPSQRGPARDQFGVGRSLGIRADTSTRHRSRRWRARALATPPAGRVFSAGLVARTLALRTKQPGRLIWPPVDSALLCPVPSFRVSNFPVSNFPAAILPVPILPVPFSPVQQALDRRKASMGARASTLPKQFDLGMTLIKMPLIKMMRKMIWTADSTLEKLVWHRFRLWQNAFPY